MRLIGTLPDTAQARRFVAYLHTVGIESTEEEAAAGRQIWIRDEDLVERAKVELDAFRLDPAASKFLDAEKQSRELSKSEQTERAKRRDRVVTGKEIWTSVGGPPASRLTVTWAMIGASVVIFALIGFGPPQPDNWAWEWGRFGSPQAVVEYATDAAHRGEPIERLPFTVAFARVLQGQVWRLFTPMFFHFSVMHLVFNMIAFYQLGGQIEDRVRAWRYLLLVLFFAGVGVATPALAPLAWGGSINTGGMSAVVYGCFGYILIKTLIEPNSGYRLSAFFAAILIGWHLITSFPNGEAYFGPMVSNVDAWGHGGGFVAGVVAAGATYLFKQSRA